MKTGVQASGFSIINGAFAITYESGIYRQPDIYEMEGTLYIRAKGGYVRLLSSNRTSHPKISWSAIDGVLFKLGKTNVEIDNAAK